MKLLFLTALSLIFSANVFAGGFSSFERYKNTSGYSGVSGYKIKATSITVLFRDGSIYLYNYSRPGKPSVDYMKTLARSGSGLNGYINTAVRRNYAQRIR